MKKEVPELCGSVPRRYDVSSTLVMCNTINACVRTINELSADMEKLKAEIKELKKGGKDERNNAIDT